MSSLNETVKQIFLEEFARYITDNADQSIDNETVANVSNELNAVLQESGALVAGGFLTRCANIAQNGFEGEDRQAIMRGADIDIYVTCDNLEMVSTFFSNVGKFVINRTNTVKAYDQSFFRKNNIMQRFHYRIPAEMENWTRRGRRKSIDIMSIKQGVSPLNVVQNFDLTFCEIWYDGRSINATNLADAAQKKGLLRSDYVKALLDFNNRFIRDRLDRYRARGYKIKFQLDNMSNVPFATAKSRKSISDMQTWLYLAIYNSITEAFIPRPSETNKFWKLSDASEWVYRERQYDLFNQLRYMFQTANNLCNYDDVNDICVRFMSRQAIRLAAQTISEAVEMEENSDFAERIRPLLNDDVKLFQLLISARDFRQGAAGFNLILFISSLNSTWTPNIMHKYREVIEKYFMMSADDLVELSDKLIEYNAEIRVTLDSEHVDVPVCDASLPGAKQGQTYPVEMFRSLIIPNDSSYLNLQEEVDCDVGQPLPVSANIHSVENPVQVIVKQGDEAVVDTSAGKPYIFCAAELRSYLISVRQYDPWSRGAIENVHELGYTGEPLQQYMNPINRKKIIAVRFMTQDEIDETQREYLASQEEKISSIDDEQTAINQLMTSAQQRAMRSANRNRIRASMNIRGNTNSPLRRYLTQEPCMNDDDVDQILEWDPDGDPTDEQIENLTEDCRRAAIEIARERGRRLAREVMRQTEEKESEEKESEEDFPRVSDLADSLRNVQEQYFDGPAPDRRSPNQSPQYVPRSPSYSPPPIRRTRNWSESSADSYARYWGDDSGPNSSGPD